ncbi:Na+/H+ antiporter NhaA [Mycobacterium sp.]|uniref:Na+/H+ antiporter NhaA n=1 Tax=Mycobacterium sp. TaxID=1785 RepID=UPI0031DB70BF
MSTALDALDRPSRGFRQWWRADTASGLALLIATAAALVWANSPLGHAYHTIWETPVGWASVGLRLELRHWVNDGLMVVFFFVIGLELKQELTTGELARLRTAIVPALAAASGAVLPALVFLAITRHGPATAGWGIPMATDPAFAVGVLALVARRAATGVRALLLAIATVDDALAVTVIALGYSSSINVKWLAAAVTGCLLVVLLRAAGVAQIWPYVPVALAIWFATMQSGVHATIAGVVLALLTPAKTVGGRAVLARLLRLLSPFSAFVVVPVFAIVNVGVELSVRATAAAFGTAVTWAVLAGLLVGKVVGITGTIILAERSGLGELPKGVTRSDALGLGLLGALGFTVALFITEIAYTDPALTEHAKIGIFIASIVGAMLAATVFTWSRSQR